MAEDLLESPEQADPNALPLSRERLDAVAGRVGASFYVVDVGRFEDNLRRLVRAFRAVYPRTRVGCSYKTNYLPAFLRRADALGAYAEVVSRFEFELALALGVAGERIIFNGPVKDDADLAWGFAAGAVVNADSVGEVHRMVRVAAAGRWSRPVRVGIRCYLPEETPGSRFGVDLRASDGVAAVAALDAAPNVRLVGLHCHRSGERDAEAYRRRIRALIGLHREVLGGRRLEFLDVGGGLGGRVSAALAAQLSSVPASFDDYAEAIAGEMRAAYGLDGPELVLEPGMALVADTMAFVTRVEAVKDQHRPLAVVDGTMFNIQPFQDGRVNLPIAVVTRDGAAPAADTVPDAAWDVVGSTCSEIDVLHRGYRGPLRVGDFVVIDNVGAYTTVLNAPFIRGTPAIVALHEDGSEEILRPASTARDLLASYEGSR